MAHELAGQFAPKWGQPKNLGKSNSSGFNYECLRCQATWVGPNGDWCDWCHERWIANEQSKRHQLLWPEWLNWAESFHSLPAIDQEVWASTRGFRGDYQSAWLVNLKDSLVNEAITNQDFVAALNRWERWKMIQQSKPLNESFGN